MTLLINLSNNLGGGGLQVALSFIDECKKISGHKYIVDINQKNAGLVNFDSFDRSVFTFISVPVTNLLSISPLMKKIEKQYKPDAVFTVFGPSYWTPKAPHIMGYAIPHYIYPESPFIRNMSFIPKLKLSFKKAVHLTFVKMEADAVICETQDAVDRVKNVLHKKEITYHHVSNTISSHFANFTKSETLMLPEKQPGEFRFLCVSKYYPHKNLECIPKILSSLKNEGVRFVLTLDDESYERLVPENLRNRVINVGFVKPEKCPQLYAECDGVFQPSLLECFSANYVEAMYMKKPLLASDFPFARTVCSDAAVYFDPLNIEDCQEKIVSIVEDESLREEMVQKGISRLTSFPDAAERANAYLTIISEIIS